MVAEVPGWTDEEGQWSLTVNIRPRQRATLEIEQSRRKVSWAVGSCAERVCYRRNSSN